MSNLKELGDDVILAILVHLDIPTVLSLTQPHENYPDLTGFNGLVYGQETLERGKVVNLMVCFTSPHSKHFIEIIRLDLLTGQSTLLRSMQAPRRVHTYKFHRPTICGDWAVVILTFARASFLLNWKTGQHAELPLNELGRSTMDVALIPGHLFTLTTEHNRTYVSVWNSSSFDWQDGPARSRLSNPRPLVEYDLELPDGRTAQQRQIFAYAHPLHDRAYVIWAYANSAVPWLAGGPTGSSIAVKYNIYLSNSQSPRREDVWWKRGNLSITKAPKVSILPQGFPIIGWCGVSFSGHTLVGTSTTPRPLVSIVSLGQLSNYEETAGTGEFPNAHHLSPYSGTLSSICNDVVTVDYYD
ncbi:hypothetical protein H0H93_009932 [Arthromyces matolae]|nr:hypothetical protein H0H93_009932 [Arthromyces matolae]